jgi:hypothetical protein
LDQNSKGYPLFWAQQARGGEVGFIVSAVVAEEMVSKLFVNPTFRIFAPSTGPLFGVRDAKGVLIGTKRLEIFA